MGAARGRRLTTTSRLLGLIPWLILLTGPFWLSAVSDLEPQDLQTTLTVSLGVFFASLLIRLVVAVHLQPARRVALVLLTISVAVWAAGSAVLNASGTPDLTHFPSPGEWLFLCAYAGMAGFLVLDGVRRERTRASTWLETGVICGGCACLAGVLVLTPTAQHLGGGGLALLLSLLYPLLDIVLGTVVVAQLALGSGSGLRRSLCLLGGFVSFGIADAGFLTHLRSGTYDFNFVSIELWGVGFALIVTAACQHASPPSRAAGRERMRPLVLVAATAAALILAWEPTGPVRTYLIAPALLTLAAAGARLVLALREARRTAEAIRLSRSDDLTNLPNRRALLAALDARCEARQPTGLAVLDLNGFKDINDTLGHAAGDSVLVELASRMRAALPHDVLLTRLGGDEFAVVAEFSDKLRLLETVTLALDAVRSPIAIDGIPLGLDASAGLTVLEPDDAQSSELLRRADVAMYEAKRRRVGALLYDAEADNFSRELLRLGDQLRRGIGGGQLAVWYQPQVEAATGRLYGLEALVRWNHPTRGLIGPVEFLPVARRSGLMQALSDEVARLVVRDVAAWDAAGLRTQVAVNCSPPELMAGMFVERLTAMLDAAHLDARRMTIEVTEDSFMAEPYRARLAVQDVRDRGYEIAVDDYGTGFSSLSYLRDLPLQELKIDRTFVAAVTSDERSRLIVASTVQLAKALQLRTVAEGVEDAAVAADLIALGVDVLQGYHLSRPLPFELVADFARNHNALIP